MLIFTRCPVLCSSGTPVVRTPAVTHRNVRHRFVAVRARRLLLHATRAARRQTLSPFVRHSKHAVQVAKLSFIPARHALPGHLFWFWFLFSHFQKRFFRFPVRTSSFHSQFEVRFRWVATKNSEKRGKNERKTEHKTRRRKKTKKAYGKKREEGVLVTTSIQFSERAL